MSTIQNSLALELSRVFETLYVRDATSFSFAGRDYQTSQAIPPALAAPDPLTALLQWTLYRHTYSARFAGVMPEENPNAASGEDLVPAFSRANAGSDRWQPGWSMTQTLPSGQIVAQRNGLTRLLWPGEFLTNTQGLAPAPGTDLVLLSRRESAVLQPGFYFAFGEEFSDYQDESSFVRFYWNVKPSAGAALLERVTRILNRFKIPFRLKLLSKSGFYPRTDAGVLYAARRYFHIASKLLAEVYQEVKGGLNSACPLFAKELAPGLGLAEDPNNGESFGTHRCRLVAEAIVEAFRQGEQTSATRLRVVEKRFTEAGISTERPYLNPGSTDEYLWPKS